MTAVEKGYIDGVGGNNNKGMVMKGKLNQTGMLMKTQNRSVNQSFSHQSQYK